MTIQKLYNKKCTQMKIFYLINSNKKLRNLNKPLPFIKNRPHQKILTNLSQKKDMKKNSNDWSWKYSGEILLKSIKSCNKIKSDSIKKTSKVFSIFKIYKRKSPNLKKLIKLYKIEFIILSMKSTTDTS